ncbi:MAG: hypothetical protein FWG50_09600 [Kiritimatiellaeota bacterium]|nr:hypothetical protein [Kiritimatiellota bacterium]
MANRIEIGKEVGRGWELFKGNMGLLILVHLLMVVVSSCCFILAGPMLVGEFLIAQRLLKKDPDVPTVGNLFKGFEYFLNAFLCFLAVAIVCAIPVVQIIGVVAGPMMMIALMHIAFGKLSFADAVKKIFADIGTGPFWMLILTLFVSGLIAGLGALACGIGVLFTAPLAMCIGVCAYHSAYGDAASQPPPQPVADTPPLVDPPPPPVEP